LIVSRSSTVLHIVKNAYTIFQKLCILISTVKAGNVVTFGAQNNFFLRISFRWPNVICSYKIQLKKGLDVGMAIFGFCQHLGPFFLKNVGVTTLPTLRVMSSPPKIIPAFDEFTRLRVKSSPWHVFKNILETRTKR